MKRFHGSEIERFLHAVDRHLRKPLDVRVIGGAAGVLALGITSATLDIDTTSHSAPFEKACGLARAETGLEIPVSGVGLWDGPYEFESRLTEIALDLIHLRVLVPERHDWALMKSVRLNDRDIEQIKEAHSRTAFTAPTLLERFTEEMTHIEPRRRLIQHFLVLIEELFGEAAADGAERMLAGHPKWKSA